MKKDLGKSGEVFVVNYLREHGYTIIEVNHTSAIGEIDVIAKDGDELCFIEVKTRVDNACGDGLEAVDRRKQGKLIKLALLYMQDHDFDDINARFDVVAISGNPDYSPSVEIIKNAFELDSNKW